MADDPALWSATRQAEAIRSKELSSRELLDAFAARIERLNPAVNAVVTLDLERGEAAATARFVYPLGPFGAARPR